MNLLISGLSALTLLVSGWMTVMYFVLRHPGFLWRAAISAVVCLGAATLLRGAPSPAYRLPVALWGCALAALGVLLLVSPGDDGWALIAGTLFVLEGVLAAVAGLRAPA